MIATPADLLVRLVFAALATWSVTHLLAAEDGPGDLIFRLRRSLGQGWLGDLADCFNCLSLFVAAPAALLVTRDPLLWLGAWLAISGAACLLERIGGQPPIVDPFIQPHEGETDVLGCETLDDPTSAPTPNPGDESPGRAIG
jgi:hypothetical protein